MIYLFCNSTYVPGSSDPVCGWGTSHTCCSSSCWLWDHPSFNRHLQDCAAFQWVPDSSAVFLQYGKYCTCSSSNVFEAVEVNIFFSFPWFLGSSQFAVFCWASPGCYSTWKYSATSSHRKCWWYSQVRILPCYVRVHFDWLSWNEIKVITTANRKDGEYPIEPIIRKESTR